MRGRSLRPSKGLIWRELEPLPSEKADVRALNQLLRSEGFRRTAQHDGAQSWSDGSTTYLTYRSLSDDGQGAVIAVVRSDDAPTTIEAAALGLDADDNPEVMTAWKVEDGDIVEANSYFRCMVSCYGASCGARCVRGCSLLRLPSAVLVCFAGCCAAQTPRCNRLCR